MSVGKSVAKVVVSAIAIAMFVFPEPASTLTGVGILGAVWGIDTK